MTKNQDEESENSSKYKLAFIHLIETKWKEMCNTCYEEKYPKHFYEIPNCAHKFCKQCIVGFLSVSIPEGKVMNLKCWQPDCKELFTDNDIENVLSASDNKQLYVKYLKFKRIKLLNSNPNIRWCPKPGCGKPVKTE